MKEKIPFFEKFGYGLGDLASNLYWMQFVYYLNYFYTDVFGLAPSVLATMLLVVRIWDSVNDPIVGVIADRTESRWGKFRPYLLWGAAPFAIIGILTFTTPNLSPANKLIYAYVTYGLMVLIYTIVNIPYSSLMGVVSPNPKVRTTFSQMRFIMAFTGGLIVQAATLPMVAGFGSGNTAVIRADLINKEAIVITEQGKGSSLLEVTLTSPDYKAPPPVVGWIGTSFGLLNEEDEGKLVLNKTFYVNTEDYYQQAGLPYQEKTDTEDFETTDFAISGFGQYRIDLSTVFSASDEKFTNIDLAAASVTVEVINEQKGFQRAISVFAVLAAVLFVITFAATKERVRPPKLQDKSIKKDLLNLFTNVPWLILFALGIISLFHVCLRNGAIIYYFKYNVGNANLASLFMLAGTLANLVSQFIVHLIQKMMGKKVGYIVLMTATTICTFLFYFIPVSSIALLFTMHVLINFFYGPTAALVWAMYTDSADYSEWRTGRRATGLVMSACTMAQKFGYTFGGSFAMVMLTWIGYQANAEQTPRALEGIKGMMSWISAIPLIIAIVLMFVYPLSDKKLVQIEADLNERRQREETSSKTGE